MICSHQKKRIVKARYKRIQAILPLHNSHIMIVAKFILCSTHIIKVDIYDFNIKVIFIFNLQINPPLASIWQK